MVVAEAMVKLYYTHTLCGMHYGDYLVSVIVPTMVVTSAMLVAGLIPWKWMPDGALRFFVVALATTGAYVAAYLAVTSQSEKQEFRSVLRKILKRNA